MLRCYVVHVPGPSHPTQDSSSTRPSPPDGAKAIDSGAATGTGTNTPTNGNVYFDCPNCSRSVRTSRLYFLCRSTPHGQGQVASNRFAPHVSGCLKLGGSRRGAARNSNKNRCVHSDAFNASRSFVADSTSSRLPSEAGRSDSPYLVSENGHISDDGKSPSKNKSKSKAKRDGE